MHKNPSPRRDAKPPPLDTGGVLLILAAVIILGSVGVLLVGQAMIVPLASLLAIGLVLNLTVLWLERRYGRSRLWEWVSNLSNLSLLTAGLYLSWGLSSPYVPLYAIYVVANAVRRGHRGAVEGVALSVTSLLVLLALGGSLATEPLVRLAINIGLVLLIGAVAGLLGQRRIDAVRSAERRAEELAALNEIGRAISARIEAEQLLEEIRRQTGRLMDVSNLHIALLDEKTDQLIFPLFYRNGQREEVPPADHDEGLTRYVLRTRKPLLLANMPAEVTELELNYTGPPCLSWLGVPMIARERVLGVITVQSYEQPNTFDRGDKEVLQTIASQAATALENARLYQETQQRAETFRVLAEISQRLTRPAASKDVLAQLPELLEPVIPFDVYSLYLYQAQPVERMRLVGTLGLTPEERERAEQTALERHPGWVVHNQQALRAEDTSADDRVRHVRSGLLRSILYAPLCYEDRCLGTIGLGRLAPPPFSEADEQLLQAVADQAAVAVENARLYQELKDRAGELHHAYEELQTLDRQRVEFVQNISHDLRAPLTFITGYVELALKGELGPVTERQRESLEIVLDKTGLLARMAEEIIMLERPKIDLDTLIPTPLDHLAQTALQGAQATAQAARITLRTEIPDDIPRVFADPRRLMHVFDNLLSNAIKYSPDGSTVTLSMKEVGNAIQVAVKDEGIGIPEEAQAHIFERFYQVDSARPRRSGSFGLGLAIVKEVVEAHGGEVWVESEIGQGSTFYFTLPKRTDKQA
ncbi:MAG: ATP-binding protein [Anaerolineae bacterium]